MAAKGTTNSVAGLLEEPERAALARGATQPRKTISVIGFKR